MTVGPSVAAVIASIVAAVALVPPALTHWARPARTAHRRTPHDDPAPPANTVTPRRRGHAALSSRSRQRRVPVAPDIVASWLDEVARATRIGNGLVDALARAPDTAVDRGRRRGVRACNELRDRLEPLQRRLRHGESLTTSLASWRNTLHPNDDALTTAATVLIAADDVGGSVAVPLERAAALLRARAAEADERSASSAQARLSARVLGVLPVAVLGVLLIIDREVAAVLRSPIGAVLVGAGVLLDVAGFLWMRRIVRRTVR